MHICIYYLHIYIYVNIYLYISYIYIYIYILYILTCLYVNKWGISECISKRKGESEI